MASITHIPTRKVQSWKFMQDIWHHFPWLFTKRNITCGVPEMEDGKILHNCNNFRWNRVKMAKNGQKMAEINFGVSYIIIFFIFNFFCFSTFTFSYFLEQVFWVKFLKFCQNSGLLKYQMEKVEKQKKVKMKKIIMYETPKLISAIFGQFLAVFTLFHLKFLQLCKIFPSYIYGSPQVMFGLVNNHRKWCQMSCIIFVCESSPISRNVR